MAQRASDAPAHAGVPPDWPLARYSRFVSAAGLRWHVQDVGVGPVLVFLHGAGASTHSVAPLVRRLADRFRCIALDLPGHGFSAPFSSGAYTLRRTSRAVQAVLRVLDLSPHAFVGHSAGAAISLQWVLDNAVDASRATPDIVAINPALLPFAGVAGFAFPAIARVAASSRAIAGLLARHAAGPAQVRRLIDGTGSTVSVEMLDAYRHLLQRPAHVRAVLSMMAGWQLGPLMPSLRRLDPRMLVLLGGRDRAVPPDRTQQVLAGLDNCHIVRIADAGHLLHEERPAEVADLIAERLSQRPGEVADGR